MTPEIITIPIPDDNYSYCVVFGLEAIIIDASDTASISDFIENRGLLLRMILSTHHHTDHTAGNIGLKEKTGCLVAGGDRRIAGVDRIVKDHEIITIGPFIVECLAAPGHTKDGMVFYFKAMSALFTGDTLFYAGCGRLFEGSASQMAHSLKKISALPLYTSIYCGHEYTLENLRFAESIEPDNEAIDERLFAARELLDQGRSSGPSTLESELATNPFLRTDQKTIRRTVGLPTGPSEAVFAELRKRKDRF